MRRPDLRLRQLLPDQIIANVQTALQQDGYYLGPINGSLDSATRAAIANYQRDQAGRDGDSRRADG